MLRSRLCLRRQYWISLHLPLSQTALVPAAYMPRPPLAAAYSDITEIVVEHQKPKEDCINEEPPVEALEVMEANCKASNAKQFNRRFTPPAPLAQGTNVNGVARLHLPAICHPSSESNFAALSSLESPTCTMNQRSQCAHAEKSEKHLSVIPYNQYFDSSSASKVDSPSPGWNGFTGICNISPSSGPSPSLCGSSTSRTQQAKIYYTKLFPDRETLSGASLQHCPPATTQGRFGEGKFIIKPATGGPHYNLADETPEILKDAHSPTKTVKASSLNQKRVSPPKKMVHEIGSSFSPGLKSGRKYVLHSISQFPSLTPYRNNSKEKSTGNLLEEKNCK